MKAFINNLINKFGYQIKKLDNGFTINSNLNWLKSYQIHTVLDIGANCGQFASFVSSVFPNSLIYSFEPIRSCYTELLELKSKIKKLIPLNYALGEINGIMDFYVNDFTPSSSFLKMEEEHIKNFPNTKRTRIEKIELKKLDCVFKDFKIEKEVLVKIDVQGFEEKVIKGGEQFFSKIPKIVIIEASIKSLYHNEIGFEELFDKFRDMGYKYKGNLNQLYSPLNGSILQVDAVFIKN